MTRHTLFIFIFIFDDRQGSTGSNIYCITVESLTNWRRICNSVCSFVGATQPTDKFEDSPKYSFYTNEHKRTETGRTEGGFKIHQSCIGSTMKLYFLGSRAQTLGLQLQNIRTIQSNDEHSSCDWTRLYSKQIEHSRVSSFNRFVER